MTDAPLHDLYRDVPIATRECVCVDPSTFPRLPPACQDDGGTIAMLAICIVGFLLWALAVEVRVRLLIKHVEASKR